ARPLPARTRAGPSPPPAARPAPPPPAPTAAAPPNPRAARSAAETPRRGASSLPCLYYLVMTRVLLAEDDTSISEPLSRALRREGYEVDVTADGPSTLDKALGEGVDLILLDIGLPQPDGLEVGRPARARGDAGPGRRL